MTITEIREMVGRQILVDLDGLTVSCQVIDAKTGYGKVRLLVKPVAGAGQKWIETSRVVKGLK